MHPIPKSTVLAADAPRYFEEPSTNGAGLRYRMAAVEAK